MTLHSGSLGLIEANGPLPIIDDGNASFFEREIADPNTPFNGGFNSESVIAGLGNPFSRTIMPRSEWDDNIRRQEAEQSSPDHWRLAGGVPVMDQSNWGFCWFYGLIGAVNTAYAQTGMEGLRLNPWPTAYLGKNGRNVGGWAGEGLGYFDKWGTPEESVWDPNNKTNDRALFQDHGVQLNSKMHNAIETEELERNNFDALVSALLDPERPTPVTMGLQWWGHLIYATKAVKISNGKYGVKIVNSWKPSWGEQGCAVLAQNKATAFEQIAIVRVKPRVVV